jgi:hypothetical protein
MRKFLKFLETLALTKVNCQPNTKPYYWHTEIKTVQSLVDIFTHSQCYIEVLCVDKHGNKRIVSNISDGVEFLN